ncbi:hypothetical protein HWN40_11745 [Methanolobus zinderi]|jgi:hypothetical protein|uniref:Uncharacterized protein n=1 Tax=Methanolobus zinderi TaxID=536044 RepID=A0A7D5EGG6_9EURY|nr:hypothetical protein [Methanolobus zinderi]KXS44751.1 MAG: hypothetical protein AWU59_296 [Methanolobus sp. T82-4]QLC50854.1 hypothetical protein HWN40_11745 [Methanolobus zinderi]
MLWSYSKLDESTVKTIEELEKKLDVTLLAFSGQDIKNAELSADDLKQIEEVESKLGLSLVAVKA